MAKVLIPFIDFSGERSTLSMYVADGILDAAITSLFNAVVGVTIGNAQKSILSTDVDKDSGTAGAPANGEAQREKKWLVRVTDDVTGEKGSFEIPCADLTGTLVAGTNLMDLSAGVGATLQTQIETNVESRDGNAVSVQSVEFVGRNL